MTGHPHRARLSVIGVVALVACGAAPLVTGLQDVTIALSSLRPTANLVVYGPTTSFERPAVGVKTVTIRGSAALQGLTVSVQLEPYARATDPASASTCVARSGFLICNASNEVVVGPALSFAPGDPPQAITLSGDVLAQAINQGRVWLGLRVLSGSGNNLSFELRSLSASVTLL
jgi:hypothetical protein